MTDFIEVKPVRTFALGKELKTKRSKPFPVEAGEAKMLRDQGLVEFEGAADPAPAPTADRPTEPAADPEPVVTSDKPAEPAKKRGRANAVELGT
ncbi:hypothetical protein ACLBXM_09270 [Xanthobacteraceae bacterium A53D]